VFVSTKGGAVNRKYLHLFDDSLTRSQGRSNLIGWVMVLQEEFWGMSELKGVHLCRNNVVNTASIIRLTRAVSQLLKCPLERSSPNYTNRDVYVLEIE